MAKVGRILLQVAEIAAIVAINVIPGVGQAISATLGVSTFLAITIGTIAVTLGFGLLSSLLFKPQTANADQAKYNVRLPAPPRYIAGGHACVGGAVVFAEFDSAGNLWVVVVHADSILTNKQQYYFDNQAVTFDGTGDGEGFCNTPDFCLNSKGDLYKPGDAGQSPYFYVWTRTYTESNPIPPAVPALQTAFPDKWQTVNHLLVGTTYSVMRCSAIKVADRYKMYRWRGTLGMGEPAISIAGQWSNMYDPRDPSQVLGDRTTYKPSDNAEIVWAWFRTHKFGRNKAESEINWDRVAEQANICDQDVVGIEGTQKRYACGHAIIDNKQRAQAEQEIMMASDGQIVFDEQGKTWLRVGQYYEPTLSLSRNRDIITMASIEAQNGESETQGVIVNFLDPQSGYTSQPSAPWYNPNYYTPGQGATFLTVDALTVQNHNQAMRLAKSIGMRSQPLQKIGPTVGLRGLRAMEERIVNIVYDNTFAGDYEICTPVEVDESGLFCSLGLVPIDQDRFNLLPGEEKPKPVTADATSSLTPNDPLEVDAFYQNNQIKATFVKPLRNDVTYQFEYIDAIATDDHWLSMSVDMDGLTAASGLIDTTHTYYVRWRSFTTGGYASNYVQITLDGQAIGLGLPTDFTVASGVGSNELSWRNPTDSRFAYTQRYRSNTNDYTTSTQLGPNIIGGLGEVQTYTDMDDAGTYYYWVVAFNSDASLQSNPVGPVSGTIT